MRRVRERHGARRGQSIVEYLVVAGAIIAIVIGVIGPLVTDRFENLGNQAGDAIDRAADTIGTIGANPH